MRPSAFLLCALASAAAILGTACRTYVPARMETVAPDAMIAVTLTATGTDSLERALGPGVSRVVGSFSSVTGDELMVRVQTTEGARAPERRWSGESVALPRRFVAQIERSQFSRLRTGLATAGVITAIAVLNAGFGGAGKSQGIVPAGGTGGK